MRKHKFAVTLLCFLGSFLIAGCSSTNSSAKSTLEKEDIRSSQVSSKPKRIELTGHNTVTRYTKQQVSPHYKSLSSSKVRYIRDVPYEHYGRRLVLQIMMPKNKKVPNKKYPGIVFVQGSGWLQQELYRPLPRLRRLVNKGYVVSLMQYRDSESGYHFPAPIIDAKNAIRFMKAHANNYHVQKNNMIIMGDSSGGQVATMAGMTAKTNQFDRPINNQNAHVKGIIDLYGAVDLNMNGGFPSTGNSHSAQTPEGMEMGFNIRQHERQTDRADSKNYVNNDFPATLIVHGTSDRTVSEKESIELYNALKNAGKPVHLYLIQGAGHAVNAFYDQRMVDIYDQFIKQCLKK